MKLRHVRSVAVVAVVLVALTGARRGGDSGGGCDDNKSSSSSSSSSDGYSSSGGFGSDDGYSSGGTSTSTSGSSSSGSSSTGKPSGVSGSRDSDSSRGTTTEANEDFWLDRCQIRRDSATEGDVLFTYRITNGNSRQYANYNGTLEFVKKSDGTVLATAQYSVTNLAPGKTKTGRVHATALSYANDMETLIGKCTIKSVHKSNVRA
ncbi:hypothetical protein [Streptomyces spiramyceticus]|uniref:hypothetical protein n=1 Tax=Streptomyces spiramyceticus TaxID=299717 RepID=UPI00237B1996|nr:hypothetical protein [Streptomyces spiramyceticus]